MTLTQKMQYIKRHGWQHERTTSRSKLWSHHSWPASQIRGMSTTAAYEACRRLQRLEKQARLSQGVGAR